MESRLTADDAECAAKTPRPAAEDRSQNSCRDTSRACQSVLLPAPADGRGGPRWPTPGAVKLSGSDQIRFFATAGHFPGKAIEGRRVSAAFTDFHDVGGRKLLQAGFEFGSEFHGRKYNVDELLDDMFYFASVKRNAVTAMEGCSLFQAEGTCSKEISKSRRAPGVSGGGSSTDRDSRKTT
jgi:hypothetical protein